MGRKIAIQPKVASAHVWVAEVWAIVKSVMRWRSLEPGIHTEGVVSACGMTLARPGLAAIAGLTSEGTENVGEPT